MLCVSRSFDAPMTWRTVKTTAMAKPSRAAARSPSELWSDRSETWLMAASVSTPRAGRLEPRNKPAQLVAEGAS